MKPEDIYRSEQKEEEQLAPSLYKLRERLEKPLPPKGYFEALPAQLLEQIKEEKATEVSASSVSWKRITWYLSATAACILLFIGVRYAMQTEPLPDEAAPTAYNAEEDQFFYDDAESLYYIDEEELAAYFDEQNLELEIIAMVDEESSAIEDYLIENDIDLDLIIEEL